MKKRLFTMIEIAVVVLILLFLVAGLYVVGAKLFKKYYDMQGKMEFLKIENGLAAYKSALGEFPPDYMSSSQNEDGSGATMGRWHLLAADLGEGGGWGLGNYVLALQKFDKMNRPNGLPIALVKCATSGTMISGAYCVFIWDWHDDIGGLYPAYSSRNQKRGYECRVKSTIPDDTGSIRSYFGETFSGKYSRSDRQIIIVNGVIEVAKGSNMQHCGAPELPCGKSVPTNMTGEAYSCGWHDKKPQVWEGAYNRGESAKALYDFLCRPMKSRMKDGVPISPKFEGAKPFIEVSTKLTRPASKPPVYLCGDILVQDNPENYKRFGEGLYNRTDSFELIDVWGESYMYVSSANEYTFTDDTRTPPYLSFWVDEFSNVSKTGFKNDLYPPYYNPSSYDLGSKGPDKRAQNWIPFDFKLGSDSGYMDDNNALEDVSISGSFIFGQQKSDSDDYFLFYELPSDDLTMMDYDNDNINNFNQNQN